MKQINVLAVWEALQHTANDQLGTFLRCRPVLEIRKTEGPLDLIERELPWRKVLLAGFGPSHRRAPEAGFEQHRSSHRRILCRVVDTTEPPGAKGGFIASG